MLSIFCVHPVGQDITVGLALGVVDFEIAAIQGISKDCIVFPSPQRELEQRRQMQINIYGTDGIIDMRQLD